MLESPWLVRQVESHLVFGPLSRHVPIAYLAFGIAALALLGNLLAGGKPTGQRIGSILDNLILLALPFLLLRMSIRQQAIVGWIAVKGVLGLLAVLLATAGAAVSFSRGEASAWPDVVLGLIWMPGPEFIPKVTPHQRYVTLARMVLSVPWIYLGVQSGNWQW